MSESVIPSGAKDNRPTEHFCTLFDANFLPLGLSLYESLRTHCPESRLWVICLDKEVEAQLRLLAPENLTTIALDEVESEFPSLRAVRSSRSWRAYCWTLSPFVYQTVFSRHRSARRVTYLDADLFFYDSPRILLEEFEQSGRHVLMTEHAYDPRYDASETSGRYCVQFITFDRSAEAREVMAWWQQRCLEWCHERVEAGKFGDQKYLEQWPVLFGGDVHVFGQVEKTLAPWNVGYFDSQLQGNLDPVFYHFHSLRIVAADRVRLCAGYEITPAGRLLYDEYLLSLSRSMQRMNRQGINTPTLPLEEHRGPYFLSRLKAGVRKLLGRDVADRTLSVPLP